MRGPVSVSERLRDLRVRAGLTKTALAKPKYTVSFVSQIEAGRRNPSPDAVAFFADRLGVSSRYLATGVPEHVEEELRYRLEEARELLRTGHPSEAEASLRHVRERAGEYGLPSLANQAVAVLGEALGQLGKMQEALDAYEEAMEGDLPDREAALAAAGLHNAYAFICLEIEPPRTVEARRHLEEAEAFLEQGAAAGDLAYVLTERARLELIEERFEEALRYAEEALTHVARDALEAARSMFLQGRALAALGRSDEARAVLREAAESFGRQGARQQEAA